MVKVKATKVEVNDAQTDPKKELIEFLKTGKKSLVRDLGKDQISIATGGEKSVVVKIIGYTK